MKCTRCGAETEQRWMKVGCLAFIGSVCIDCNKAWNDGSELTQWDDLTPYMGKP